MIFHYRQTIPFTYTDEKKHLTPGSCIDLFQDAANFHTQAVVSQDYLARSNRVWILNYWHILFDSPCRYNDQVTISTWSAGSKGMFAHRNYTIEQQDGTTCVRALSYWFLYDMVRRRPVRIRDEDIDWYKPSPALELGEDSRKIPLPDAMEPQEPVKICRYMIDGYGHVNNAWYVKLASEYLPPEKHLRELRVEYRSAAHLGDTFYPAVAQGEARSVVTLNSADGKPCAIVEATF